MDRREYAYRSGTLAPTRAFRMVAGMFRLDGRFAVQLCGGQTEAVKSAS
jgi:hypothetical protein